MFVFFVLIVQIKVVRRVGRVPPPPPPTTTTLKSCDDNFYFLQKQKVYIQFKKRQKNNHGSLFNGTSCARRLPIRTHFRHCNFSVNMFPPVKILCSTVTYIRPSLT